MNTRISDGSMFSGMSDAHIAHAVRWAERHYQSIGRDPLYCDVALCVLRDCDAPEQPAKPEPVRLRDELRERAALPEPLDYLRYATQHAINVDDEGVDFAIPRPMIDALAHLKIIEKIGRGKWSVNVEVAQTVVSALASVQPFPAGPGNAADGGYESANEYAARKTVGQEPVCFISPLDAHMLRNKDKTLRWAGTYWDRPGDDAVPVFIGERAQAVDPNHVSVIEMLLTVAQKAHNLADNANDMKDCENVEHSDWVALCAALDALDGLPDDQPGYTMTEEAKARWALRGLIDSGKAVHNG